MVLLRKALILGYPAAPSSARSSADQSIGLRSQGSWVRIPPGAPASIPEELAERRDRALDSCAVDIEMRDEAHARTGQHQDISFLQVIGERLDRFRRHGGEHHVGMALHGQAERAQSFCQ